MSTCISIFNNIIYNSGYLGDLSVTGSLICNYVSGASADLSGYVSAPRISATSGIYSTSIGMYQYPTVSGWKPMITGGVSGTSSFIDIFGSYSTGTGSPSNNYLHARVRGNLEATGTILSHGAITSRSSGSFIGKLKCDYIESTGVGESTFHGALRANSVLSTPSAYVSENLDATEIYSSSVVVMDSMESPTSYYAISAPANQDGRGVRFPIITEASGTVAISQSQTTGATPGLDYVEFPNGRKIIWFEDSTPTLFAAPPGSLFINTESNASTGSALYIKATGTGTAGWRNIA